MEVMKIKTKVMIKVISNPMSFLGEGISGTRSLPRGGCVQGVRMSGGGYVLRAGYSPPNMRHQGGGCTHGWQVDGVHPTGMLVNFRSN